MNSIPLILLASLLLSSCVTTYRPPPQVIEQIYSPQRGGVIRHMFPQNPSEKKHYKLASSKLMTQFCKGDFEVVSQKQNFEQTGVTTSIVNPIGTGSVAETNIKGKPAILVNFICPNFKADD